MSQEVIKVIRQRGRPRQRRGNYDFLFAFDIHGTTLLGYSLTVMNIFLDSKRRLDDFWGQMATMTDSSNFQHGLPIRVL